MRSVECTSIVEVDRAFHRRDVDALGCSVLDLAPRECDFPRAAGYLVTWRKLGLLRVTTVELNENDEPSVEHLAGDDLDSWVHVFELAASVYRGSHGNRTRAGMVTSGRLTRLGGKGRPRKDLGDEERAVLSVLLEEGASGRSIVRRLRQKGSALSEATLRRRVKELRRCIAPLALP